MHYNSTNVLISQTTWFLNSNEAFKILKSISVVIIWMMSVFVLCDFRDKVTNQFASLDDSYYDMFWYYLPIDQQKQIISSISNAKLLICLEGCGRIHSTRESFKKVEKKISGMCE